MSIELLTLIIVTLVSSALCIVIYSKNPESATNKSYSLLAASIVFWAVIMYLTINPPLESQRLFLIRLSMLAAIIMSYASLILCHTIPSTKLLLNTKQIYLITSISIVGCVTAMSPYMFSGLTIENGNIEPISGPGMIMFLVSGLGYTLLSLIILARKYRRSSGLVKNQLLFVFIGLLIMFSLLIFANFIVVLVFKNSSLINFGPLFTLPFLVMTAYAIVRTNLLDINVLAMRTLSFTILLISVVILYAASLFTITKFFPQQEQYLVSVLLAVILAFSFNPIKKFIENITNSILFHESYSSDEFLEKLGEITRSSLSIDTITNNIMTILHSSLKTEQIQFLITLEENNTITRSKGYSSSPKYSENTLHNFKKISNDSIVYFQDLDESSTKMLLREHNISAIMPLKVKSTSYGLLLLGNKYTGEVYTSQDRYVLEISEPQISLAIQNAISYSKIKHFADTLKEEVETATYELKAANRHLKHLDRLKNEFIFIATHELKNPVTAMRGYLSMLSEGLFGKIPEKMKEPFDQLNASNQQLVELVNDLLQIARTEAKSLTINSEVVDLCNIVDVITGNLKALSDQKHLKVIHACNTSNHAFVYADPQRVKEIINNLVSNAIKYSEKGTITISHEIKDDLVICHVADEGVGISKQDQQKLYTRFFRVEEEAAKGIPGTGLGLYIIKQIIEKMGGQIWLKSEVGKGSTFSFSLPQVKKS
jgi:signal transduction histidine kinase